MLGVKIPSVNRAESIACRTYKIRSNSVSNTNYLAKSRVYVAENTASTMMHDPLTFRVKYLSIV